MEWKSHAVGAQKPLPALARHSGFGKPRIAIYSMPGTELSTVGPYFFMAVCDVGLDRRQNAMGGFQYFFYGVDRFLSFPVASR